MKFLNCLTMATLSIGCAVNAIAQETTFAEPEFLRVGNGPMNADGNMMYPSPVLMDIDQDNQNELVIGTIFGALYSCENQSEQGDTVWSKPVAINSTEGKPLDLNNW